MIVAILVAVVFHGWLFWTYLKQTPSVRLQAMVTIQSNKPKGKPFTVHISRAHNLLAPVAGDRVVFDDPEPSHDGGKDLGPLATALTHWTVRNRVFIGRDLKEMVTIVNLGPTSYDGKSSDESLILSANSYQEYAELENGWKKLGWITEHGPSFQGEFDAFSTIL